MADPQNTPAYKKLLLSTVGLLQAIAVLLLISILVAPFNPAFVIPMWLALGWLAYKDARRRRYWAKRAAELGLSARDAQLFIDTGR